MTEFYLKTKEGKKQVLIGLVVAMIVLAFEAIRYAIQISTDIVFWGADLYTVVESYGYAVGLIVTMLGLICYIQHLSKQV